MDTTENGLLQVFEALANPHRLRIVASLREKRKYVSELAREINMSRPLLYMHLQRLETAGLVAGNLELSEDGKAMKYYELTEFDYRITPESITDAARKLNDRASSSLADGQISKEEEQ
ncbi:ArsR/SmtB family transcription factor [Cohnella herbarum]|uniref:Winged helix-turn-helix transcriptional regulator n=1 Tax=Cohnella herbarum TaxID=2728023 RepID=A0A7Z2VM32_9BACL|nr:winged helix-turn-helix domain-containing protein [Cohnella herbarum]QJD85450.1 winged helix-turn-helix transcriptional regulator [Cohnella herbarum]